MTRDDVFLAVLPVLLAHRLSQRIQNPRDVIAEAWELADDAMLQQRIDTYAGEVPAYQRGNGHGCVPGFATHKWGDGEACLRGCGWTRANQAVARNAQQVRSERRRRQQAKPAPAGPTQEAA